MSGRSLAIIDPPGSLDRTTASSLRAAGFGVEMIGSPDELRENGRRSTDLVIIDACALHPGGAPHLIARIRRFTTAPILQISGCSILDEVCRSHPVRADGFLVRPLGRDELLRTVARLLSRGPDKGSFNGLIGGCAAMREVFEAIRRVAATDCTVLVTGETGTGKELVARAIHDRSQRADGPYVTVDCGSLPESLLESELFGYVRGAFTGADRDKPGLFEASDGGTLFLDEVGDMPLQAQTRLLRAIEEREVRRIGANGSVPFDARIIAATRRDLPERVRAGRFREDLFYRLHGFALALPALRERPGDLEELVQGYLSCNRVETTVAPEAMAILRAHDWPGNVRELLSVIESSLIRAEGSEVLIQHLPSGLLEAVRVRAPEDYAAALEGADPGCEANVILSALQETDGNRERAARYLGMSRTTLWRRMRELGLRY